MTYFGALAAILWGGIFAVFASWYVRCVFTMLFRCARPIDFFSDAYPTSGPFVFVNVIILILASAWVLMVVTN